jgi:hypothetical protein
MVAARPGLHDGDPFRSAVPRPFLRTLLLLALPSFTAVPLRAAPQPAEFPPTETFRSLRLTTLVCGRDNTTEACDQARSQADSLLDHPRLPASCKDALWQIRQKAHTAPTNSFPRRDPIDQAAQDVWTFCRQQPVRTSEESKPKPQQGPGNFGLIRSPGN